MANLHFNDTTLNNRSDHLFKIRPILDAFVEKFVQSIALTNTYL